MIKNFVKQIFGGDQASSEKAKSPDEVSELEHFVDYVVKALVDEPQDVHIEVDNSSDDSKHCTLNIHCRKDDIGKIIGKKGRTIMAIRSLVSGAASRLKRKVSVEVID